MLIIIIIIIIIIINFKSLCFRMTVIETLCKTFFRLFVSKQRKKMPSHVLQFACTSYGTDGDL